MIAPEPRGSGEAELASEARGSGEMELSPEPRRVGRDRTRSRAHEGRAFVLLFFAVFYPLNLSILFYGTQQMVI